MNPNDVKLSARRKLVTGLGLAGATSLLVSKPNEAKAWSSPDGNVTIYQGPYSPYPAFQLIQSGAVGQRGLDTNQTVTDIAGGTAWNRFYLGETNVYQPTNILNGWRFEHSIAGGNAAGARNTIEVLTTLAEPTHPSNTVRFYCAAAFIGNAPKGDGGYAGNYRGAVFGSNHVVTLSDPNASPPQAAPYMANATAAEFNTNCQVGSSVWYKSGIQIAGMETDKVQGDAYDAMVSLSNIGGAVGFKTGILFSSANGDKPIADTGSLIATADDLQGDTYQYATMAKRGIDFTYHFSDYAIYAKNTRNYPGSGGLYVDISWGAYHSNVILATVGPREQFKVDGQSDDPIWIRVNGALRKVVIGDPAPGGGNYLKVL